MAVVDAMTSTKLRPLKESDRDIVFQWRNDPLIVSLSSSQKTVSRTEHDSWFPKMLISDDIKAFVVEADGKPAGQLRFERKPGGLCEVTIYLMDPYKGQGRGVEALRLGLNEICKHWPDMTAVAYIRSDNEASISAFMQAGFKKGGMEAPRAGHDVYTRRLAN